MKKFLLLLSLIPSVLFAQNELFSSSEDYKPFKHMEVGFSAGTTGIGVELSTPINEHLNARVGFAYMPKITITKPYAMTSVGGLSDDYPDDPVESRIQRLCGYMSKMVNSDNIDEYVDMEHQLQFYNAKVLVDWYPFRKKNWHFTGGLFIGNKTIAKAINTQAESPTMLAILMYNNMYDQIQNLEPYTYPSIQIGSYYYELDPFAGETVIAGFNYHGKVACQVGEFPDGTPHYLMPNEDGIMKAEARTNVVKPYLGAGYTTHFGPRKCMSLSVDAGALILFRAPHIMCEDGVCLTHDVTGVGGQVGSLLNIIKSMPIYPSLEIKFGYSIF